MTLWTQAADQRDQALRDLEELVGQAAEGEIDPDTVAALEDVYRRDLAEAESVLATVFQAPPSTGRGDRARLRWTLGVVLAASLAVLFFSAGQFVQQRQPGQPLTGGFQGVAGTANTAGAFDPSDYSDEALEAVVAANMDDPQIAGMRIALADRYFGRGDYQMAFAHYRAVIEAESPPAGIFVATAYSRLGWMVYDGNGEVTLAVGLLDRALELVPGDPQITYIKAIVLWCGNGDSETAVGLLDQVLESPGLSEEDRPIVQSERVAAEQGQPCQ
ncbi:MAG: tetratricopeptide repeat protein [Acidimicrobiia bacterium]